MSGSTCPGKLLHTLFCSQGRIFTFPINFSDFPILKYPVFLGIIIALAKTGRPSQVAAQHLIASAPPPTPVQGNV